MQRRLTNFVPGARTQLTRSRALRLGLIAAILLGAWLAVEPHLARAGRVDPRLPAHHQQVLESLASRIEGARAVIGINRRGDDVRIILWMRDGAPIGVVGMDEIAVIDFRASLQTLILFEPDPTPARLGPLRWPDEPAEILTGSTDEIEGWIIRPDVRTTILAADLSDLTVTPEESAQAGPAVLRIDLKWSGDRADVAHRGTASVDTVLMRREAKESLN